MYGFSCDWCGKKICKRSRSSKGDRAVDEQPVDERISGSCINMVFDLMPTAVQKVVAEEC